MKLAELKLEIGDLVGFVPTEAGAEKKYIALKYWSQSDFCHLSREYKVVRVITSLEHEALKEIEEDIEFWEAKLESGIFLRNIRMHPYRNIESLRAFIKRLSVEVKEVLKKNNVLIDTDDFIVFGYDISNCIETQTIDAVFLADAFNAINALPSKAEKILAFYLLMKVIGAIENIPDEYIYNAEYKRYIRNTEINDIPHFAAELFSFMYRKQEKIGGKFKFDGTEKEFEFGNIIFGLNSSFNPIVKNNMKITTDTSDFEYFFFKGKGLIRKRSDEWDYDWKAFDIGEEVVKLKEYDPFETVDRYSL